MPAKNSTTVPIREADAQAARLAAAHSNQSLVDYSSAVIGDHARKLLARLGVPLPKSADRVSKS